MNSWKKKKVERCWHTRNLTKHSELSEKRSDTTVKQERLQCLGVPTVEHQLQHSPSSVQFSRSVVSDSLWPHEPQHTRPSNSLRPHELQHTSLPVHYQRPEFIQTHVHWLGDAIQPFHPLSSPSLPAFNLSQHQVLFKCVNFASDGQSIGASASSSVLSTNIQDWFTLGLTGLISLQSKGLSRVFSNTTVQKNQFFGAQLSLQSNFHVHSWPLEKP